MTAMPDTDLQPALEAPDRERLTLTFRDERAQTLVRSDVIVLDTRPDCHLVFIDFTEN
jgi:hypothetical protein